jgi:hypothetical protein
MYPYDYIVVNKKGQNLQITHHEREQTEDFFDVLKWRLDRDRSNIIVIVGEQGSGKSNTGLYLVDRCNSLYYDKPTTLENNVFNSIKDFVMKMKNLQDCFILIEEVGTELNSKDWRQATNRVFRDIIETFRIKHINLIMTLPNLCDLDKSTRYLSHFIIKMEYPSKATIFRKLTSFLTDKIRFKPVWNFEDIPDMKLYNISLWKDYLAWHEKYLDNKNDEWIDEISFNEDIVNYRRNWYKMRSKTPIRVSVVSN